MSFTSNRVLLPVWVGFVAALAAPVQAAELRGFWVDAWGAGLRNAAEVRTLLGTPGDPNDIGRIREANCNAVFVQVRRRADVCYPSGLGEPYFSGLSPSNFNALQAIINAAHDTTGGKQRVEVHAWIVTFATSSGGNPPAGSIYYQHNNPADPDNYWMTRDNNGVETDDRALDPGHPKCLQYLTDVCMDLVNNFDIDGLHYDYIRFTANNQGYNPTSIARYNARYGLSGQPLPTNEQFKQWRRDQVTALVRKVYANIQAVKPHVKQSASVVTWNPSPVASTRAAFMNTRPYYDVYSDWDAWMQEGILDMSVPMTYYNQASLPNDYQRWMNFQKDRKFNRHNIVGPGIYLNSLSNAILQLQKTREATPAGNTAQGFSGYSYRVPYSGGTWTGFAPSLVANVTPTPDTIPVMPWKVNPTKGHMMGTVTYLADGTWADGATVSITGPESRTQLCDGTGFYAFIDLAPGTYAVTVSKTGYPNAGGNVTVTVGQMAPRNFQLGAASAPPQISNVVVSNVTNSSATVTWNTDQPATSQVEYGLTTGYGLFSPLSSNPVTSHSVALTGLQATTLYHFRVLSGNANGTSLSADFTFNTDGLAQIQNVQVTVAPTSAVVTWQTTAPADSRVEYGLTDAYGNAIGTRTRVLSHSVTLTDLTPGTLYHYRVISSNDYGAPQTLDSTFTTSPFSGEIIVDNLDTGWSDTSPSGVWSSGSIATVPKIGSNYLFTAGVTSTDESAATRRCRWTPNLPFTGQYDVYAFYQMGTNRTASAPYKVVYNGGQTISLQNQFSPIPEQGGWFLLAADLPFSAGTAGYVELSNNTGDTAFVSADAVKFVLKTDTTPPSTPVVTDEGLYTASRQSLSASWTTTDAESGVQRIEYRIVQQGGGVIRDWTDAGVQTEVDATGLTLGIGLTYVFEVRATNNANLVSEVGSSDGITVFTFDVNDDTHVDATDTEVLLLCLSGANIPYPNDAGANCPGFDVDDDGDVDQQDFGVYQRCVTGATGAIIPACMQP